MQEPKISPIDFETLSDQLQRPPEGAREIVYRDSWGMPVVFRAHPIVREKPFPNLYWLSHPKLCLELDRLEASGLIKKLERDVLPQNPQMTESLVNANLRYIQKRLSHLDENELKKYPESFLKALKTRGIGGITNFQSVRCLHTHYAQHLVDGNPIGEYLNLHYPHLRQSL